MIVETDNNTENKKEFSAKEKKELFLKGLEAIFKHWTALRMSMDTNGSLVYNNIQEVSNEKGEIVEELMFNISIGSIYEEICTILIKEKAINFQERLIGDLIKNFIQEYFFLSLEDESEKDIAKRVTKLFKQLMENNTTLYDSLMNMKLNVKYNIPFPCKVDDEVEYSDDESDEDEENEDDRKEREKEDMELDKEIKEELKKKEKIGINEQIPELLKDDFIKEEDDEDDDGFVEVCNNKKKKERK